MVLVQKKADFAVVIPVLRPTPLLERAIQSVIWQQGPASVHLHIQDASLSTLVRGIVDKYVDCQRERRITLSQEADRGPADAINRGFRNVNGEFFSWLGADDFLLPWCFNSIATFVEQHSWVSWITGQPLVVSQSGIPSPPHGRESIPRYAAGFSRLGLSLGLHAGRLNHPIVQQEGTFFRRGLFDRVGQLNESYSLAFDFDLWTKLASEAELVEIVAPLAAFSHHVGQLSGDRDGYEKEVQQIRRSAVRSKATRPHIRGFLAKPENVFIAYMAGRESRWVLEETSYRLARIGLLGVCRLPSWREHLRKQFSILRKYLPSQPVLRLLARLLRS